MCVGHIELTLATHRCGRAGGYCGRHGSEKGDGDLDEHFGCAVQELDRVIRNALSFILQEPVGTQAM